jgi:glycosyltransferase involved in cell wall biosynthesis
MIKLSIIVPVFNEELSLPIFYEHLNHSEPLKKYELEIIFINDGSQDATYKILKKLAAQDSRIVILEFLRNFGKEAALFAGLVHSTGDIVIPIDVDLQDPIEVIPLLVDTWIKTKCDMVLAKRIDRSSDSFLKKFTAEKFYQIHNLISQTKITENVGDFRLINRYLVNQIISLPEKNLFMKGVLSWCGGKVEIVEYIRNERSAGMTKFSGWKLWNFAMDGITSFSTVPLRVWTYIGFIFAAISFMLGIFLFLQKLILGNPVQGYPSLIVSILFLGGIQLIGIGVLGEYIGRIYLEVKNRPRYIIKEKI